MKKISTLAAALLVGLSSTAAFANGELTGSGTIAVADCMQFGGAASQLTNDVRVVLSTGVQAAYVCDIQKASDSTNNVYIGTCSTAGTVKTRTANCVYGTAAVGVNRPKSDASCPDLDGGAALPATPNQVTGQGATVFTANSGGGQVASGFMANVGALCSAGEVTTTITAQAQ